VIVDVTEILDIVTCLRSNPQCFRGLVCLCLQVEGGEVVNPFW